MNVQSLILVPAGTEVKKSLQKKNSMKVYVHPPVMADLVKPRKEGSATRPGLPRK